MGALGALSHDLGALALLSEDPLPEMLAAAAGPSSSAQVRMYDKFMVMYYCVYILYKCIIYIYIHIYIYQCIHIRT